MSSLYWCPACETELFKASLAQFGDTLPLDHCSFLQLSELPLEADIAHEKHRRQGMELISDDPEHVHA